MCSSRSSLSMSHPLDLSGGKVDRLRKHALQAVEIGRIVLCYCLVHLLGECLRVVKGSANLRFRPIQMFGHILDISLVAAEQHHDFPYCQGASLDIGLP